MSIFLLRRVMGDTNVAHNSLNTLVHGLMINDDDYNGPTLKEIDIAQKSLKKSLTKSKTYPNAHFEIFNTFSDDQKKTLKEFIPLELYNSLQVKPRRERVYGLKKNTKKRRGRKRRSNTRKKKRGGDPNSDFINFSYRLISKFSNSWNSNPESTKSNKTTIFQKNGDYSSSHLSRIFDDDTLHDRINPIKSPYDYEDTLFVDSIRDSMRKNSIIIDRQTLLSLDDKYAIYKDYGWGSHMLGLNSLIDSASTPGIKKYINSKGPSLSLPAGNCRNQGIEVRSFNLGEKDTCIDVNDYISRGDMYIYENLPEVLKYNASGVVNKIQMNIVVMNVVWRYNLYYCIKKCVSPVDTPKYERVLDFMNKLIFTGFAITESSYVPQFTFFGQPNGLDQGFYQHLMSIVAYFDLLFKTSSEEPLGPLIKPPSKSGSTVNINTSTINIKKPITFLITQNLVAEKIKAIIGKGLNDGAAIYNSNFVIPRGGTSAKEAEFCIHQIDAMFMKLYPLKNDVALKVQRVFMFRLLKFMGDRAHISISKLVETINKINDRDNQWRQPMVLTGERPLQVSTVREGLIGAFEKISIHDEIFGTESTKISTKKFILYVPKLSFEQFCNVVALKISQAYKFISVGDSLQKREREKIRNFVLKYEDAQNAQVHIASITINDDDNISIVPNSVGGEFMPILKNMGTNNPNNQSSLSIVSIEPPGIQFIDKIKQITPKVWNDDLELNSEKWNTYKEVTEHDFSDEFYDHISGVLSKLSYLNNEMKTYGKRKKSERDCPCFYKWDPSDYFFYKLCEPRSELTTRKTLDALNDVQKFLTYIVSLHEHTITTSTSDAKIRDAAEKTLRSLISRFNLDGSKSLQYDVLKNIKNSLNVKKTKIGDVWRIIQDHNDNTPSIVSICNQKTANPIACNPKPEDYYYNHPEYVIHEDILGKFYSGREFNPQCCANLKFDRISGFTEVSFHRAKIIILSNLLAIREKISAVSELVESVKQNPPPSSNTVPPQLPIIANVPEIEPNVPVILENEITEDEDKSLETMSSAIIEELNRDNIKAIYEAAVKEAEEAEDETMSDPIIEEEAEDETMSDPIIEDSDRDNIEALYEAAVKEAKRCATDLTHDGIMRPLFSKFKVFWNSKYGGIYGGMHSFVSLVEKTKSLMRRRRLQVLSEQLRRARNGALVVQRARVDGELVDGRLIGGGKPVKRSAARANTPKSILPKPQRLVVDAREDVAAVRVQRQIALVAAEEQARVAAEEQARVAAEEQARVAAEEQARVAAEEQVRSEAEEMARLEASHPSGDYNLFFGILNFYIDVFFIIDYDEALSYISDGVFDKDDKIQNPLNSFELSPDVVSSTEEPKYPVHLDSEIEELLPDNQRADYVQKFVNAEKIKHDRLTSLSKINDSSDRYRIDILDHY